MKRIFLALFLASGALAQTPPPSTPTPSETPEPSVTPLGPSVPRYVSLIRFESHDQYGPEIPNGQYDLSYEFIVSDQNGKELWRETRVLKPNQIPQVERKKLFDFINWLRSEVERRMLPPSSLTPFPTLTPVPPTPTESPVPTAPAPSPTP